MAVNIGPLRNIVGVGWDEEGSGGTGGGPSKIEAYFWFRMQLINYDRFPCRPPGDLSNSPTPGAAMDFAQQVQLVPDDRFVSENMDGLYGILADGTELPLTSYIIGGIPSPPPPISAASPYDWSASPTREYIKTTPLLTPNSVHPSYNKSLAVEYQFWQRNWDDGEYCDWQEPRVFPFENSGYYKRFFAETVSGPLSPDWVLDNHYQASAFMDFGGFTVTWPDTGRVYTAQGLQTYSGTEFGGRVVVLLL